MVIDQYLDALKKRRTYYNIDKEISIAPCRLQEIISEITVNSPSSFNSQSSKVVLLFCGKHKLLWEITLEALRKVTPPEYFPNTEKKIASFAAGAGTILYFEDDGIVEDLQAKFPLYADNFPVWASQSSAILQANIWTALTLEGLGASLQHYNPLIDDEVKKQLELPESWKLYAQMPFGRPVEPPGEKTSKPAADMVRVIY